MTVVLWLPSCSLTSFGYNALPTWALWQLDSWLALDDGQRLLARERIESLQRWHRAEQLPQYASLITEIDEKARGGLDTADLDRWRRRILDSWVPFARQAAPAVADLLGSLKADQVERLRDKIADSNRKWLRDYAGGDAKAMAARQKRYVERAEFFFGDLTREQLGVLRHEVSAMPSIHDAMLADRESRQQRLLSLIERLRSERPTPEVARRWTEAYLLSLWETPDAARRARIEQSVRVSDALTIALWSKSNEAQRRHLSVKLRDFAEQATQLASAR